MVQKSDQVTTTTLALAGRDAPVHSPGYKRYVTFVLLVVYIFNQTDRNIFNFLMEPIRLELHLSDSQLGFLAGPALGILYSLLGVPIAKFADRSPRIRLMTIAMIAWSIIVALTATTKIFWQLALTRVGVGVGEAGFSAIAIAVLTDYHLPGERSRALSVFMLGLPLGGVLSSLISGALNQAYGWRISFLAVGLPGVLLALLMKSTVKEPGRTAASVETTPSQTLRLWEVCAMVWRRHALRHLALGQGISCLVTASIVAWIPTFFLRTHGMGSKQLGIWLALVYGIGGSAGVWLGGHMTSRAAASDLPRQMNLVAFANALIPLSLLMTFWFPVPQVALLTLLVAYVPMFFFYASTATLVQRVTTPDMRATMASIMILLQMLAGGVVGPQLLGLLSDVLGRRLGGSMGLRLSMTLIASLGLWAAAHLMLSARSIESEAVA